jgi:hypothetical protein
MIFGALLLAVMLEVSPASHYWIVSACDSDEAEVRAEIANDSALEVRYAIPGSPTCYSIIATVDGKKVRGFILGPGLEGIEAFETLRAAAARTALSSPFVIEVQSELDPAAEVSPKAPAKIVPAAIGKEPPETVKPPLKPPLKVTF